MNSTLNDAVNAANHIADDAKGRAVHVANQTRTSLIEYGTQALKLLGALRALEIGSVDSVLGRVGLQRRQSSGPMVPIVWFTAGALVAGGVALAFAPSSGKVLRRRVARWIDSGVNEVEAEKVVETVEKVATHIDTRTTEAVEAAKKDATSKIADGIEAARKSVDSNRHGMA